MKGLLKWMDAAVQDSEIHYRNSPLTYETRVKQ